VHTHKNTRNRGPCVCLCEKEQLEREEESEHAREGEMSAHVLAPSADASCVTYRYFRDHGSASPTQRQRTRRHFWQLGVLIVILRSTWLLLC
jgi:hypothetical protein